MDPEKIEKKRERNRLAAKKCRQRKLETIEDLRKQVAEWQHKFKSLENEHQRYRANTERELETLRNKLKAQNGR